jgi:hypothetical protein
MSSSNEGFYWLNDDEQVIPRIEEQLCHTDGTILLE